jgi:hypothetical protein
MVVDTNQLFANGQLSSNLIHLDTILALVNARFQRVAFLLNINKDYETLVKDEEDPIEDSFEEC